MNREEIEKEDRGISISMPLLTEKEMLEIDNNFNEIVNEVSKQYIKEKDLAIAQYIIGKQQKELEQKESILDKLTDKLKEDIRKSKEQIKYWEQRYRIAKEEKEEFYIKSYHRQINRWQSRYETLREILNIIEGEKNNE